MAHDMNTIEGRRAHALECARLNAEFMKANNIKTRKEWNELVVNMRKDINKAGK